MVWYAQYNDWSCRKSHVIKGVTGTGTNYQVAMNIHCGSGPDYQEDVYLSGLCKNDFSDVRFTVNSGGSESALNYWIESIDEQQGTAKVWVKITENLDNDCTIYLYYGNSSATSESNGTATFDFFDDFNYSPNNWTLSGAQITNGNLVLVSGGGTFQYAMKERPANLDDYRFRLKAQSFLINCGWGAYPRASHNPPCTSYSPYYYVPFFEVFDYWYARDHHAYYHTPDSGSTEPRADYSVDSNWHIYEVRKSGNNYSHCYDDNQTGTAYCTTPETGNWVAFTPLGGAPAANTNFDWVFLCKYLENGPYHDNAWGAIEAHKTLEVGSCGLVSGEGSKYTRIVSTAPVIIKIHNNQAKCFFATIENLVIEGDDNPAQIGIQIENGIATQISNVSIKNCGVGIELKNTLNAQTSDENYTECTNITHVRMIDVIKGIQFHRENGSSSFAYTYIDDVGISLKDATNCTGIEVTGRYINEQEIEVGQNCTLYGSFIRANIWMFNSNNNIGVDLQGTFAGDEAWPNNADCSITGALVQIAVTKSGSTGGTGIRITGPTNTLAVAVRSNQLFMLAHNNLASPIVTSQLDYDDIKEIQI